MARLLQLIAAVKAAGGNLSDLFAWLVAHKEELASLITLLLSLFGQQGFMAGPEPTKDECVAECVANGCDPSDAKQLCDAL